MEDKALVASDDKLILELLGFTLESNGYEITLVADEKQAIKALHVERFALVIIDLEKSRNSGSDIIRRVKDLNRETIVIMITECCEFSDEINPVYCEADDYILKPFSPGDLLVRIQFQKLKQFFPLAFASKVEKSAGNVSG